MYNFFKKNRPLYLDHAAATPLDPSVRALMVVTEKRHYANAGGLHRLSHDVHTTIEQARKELAVMIHARPEELIITRGGSESNTLALEGVLYGYLNNPNNRETRPHIITSTIEHAVVRDTLRAWRDQGLISLSEIPVTSQGILDLTAFKASLSAETILVSIMYVNNEIGTIQPLRDSAKIVRHHRKKMAHIYPLMHTDAIQAANYLDLSVPQLGFDLLSISGSKIYGPKSTAVLYKKSGIPFVSSRYGGDQEFGLRPGTPDVAGIVGIAQALRTSKTIRASECARVTALQEYFYSTLLDAFSPERREIRINGINTPRVPHILSIGFPGVSGERLVIELDARGICASAKSACQSDKDGESHVIEALYGTESGWGNVRFSLGRSSTKKDIKKTVRALVDIMTKIQHEQDILNTLPID